MAWYLIKHRDNFTLLRRKERNKERKEGSIEGRIRRKYM
jgi:hypothetical protein